MKHLFDRLMGAPGEAPGRLHAADDQGFFATQFMERPEMVRSTSAWRARALGAGAQVLDPDEGWRLLERAWGRDHFFAALDRDERLKLAAHLEFVMVQAGRDLIFQDERGDYALVVLDGVVAVDRVQPAGARARLGEAREGDVLGEMSLLDAGVRVASCVTLSPCRLAVITADTLDEFAVDAPRLGMAVMACLARRLSLRTRQLSARLGALLTSG